MSRVQVVTDSASDLTFELAQASNVVVVPITVRFGTNELPDWPRLSSDDFWARCKASPTLPETAAPSPGAFVAVYQQAAEDGCDGVVCITLSSDLSATYQAAQAAARQSPVPVHVVDSRMVTMGEGLIVLEAAEEAAAGGDLDAVVRRAERCIPRTSVLGVVDTLEHLEKGGRIGSARALLGSLLSIKPVVQVRNGIVDEESKQRTRARSLRYLADKVHATGDLERLAVVNGAAEDLDVFLAMLGEAVPVTPTVVDLGPVVGTHTGPGTIGVCMLRRA
ncbi:MAG: DegV family protein [Acidimicrobiales bacterium]